MDVSKNRLTNSRKNDAIDLWESKTDPTIVLRKESASMRKKTIAVCLTALILLLCLFFQDSIIRSYVSVCNLSLKSYAVKLIDKNERTSDRYGLWKTSCYPDSGMVEFFTGGSGLAPNSVYKGFYYSSDNTHKPFSAAPADMISFTVEGDAAFWTDGTDNYGTSTRIIDNWFWYEASF